MSASDIRTVAVIGAGLMGHGIALDFAAHGYPVRLHDRTDEDLARAVARIERGLHLLSETGHLAPDSVAPSLARIEPATDLRAVVSGADLVVEAVFEDLALKQAIFRDLDAAAPAPAILASNTSSFLPSQIAEATRRPDRVLVAHYFNPPHLLPLVELVPGWATSAETIASVRDLYVAIGKHPVVLRKEAPGFVGNRLQSAMLREAVAIVAAGIADPQDVDAIVRYGFGRRLALAGPFEVRDLSGWDVSLAVAEQLFPELASSPEVPALLREIAGQGTIAATPTAAEAAARREQIARALIAIDHLSGD